MTLLFQFLNNQKYIQDFCQVIKNVFLRSNRSVVKRLSLHLGGFNYLHVGKPSLRIRLDSLMALPDYVSTLPPLFNTFTSFHSAINLRIFQRRVMFWPLVLQATRKKDIFVSILISTTGLRLSPVYPNRYDSLQYLLYYSQRLKKLFHVLLYFTFSLLMWATLRVFMAFTNDISIICVNVIVKVSSRISTGSVHEITVNKSHSLNIFLSICSYFKESWCVALFHDRFKDLRAEIREILSNVQVNGDWLLI
jgi:hypothetical protein